jgi:hypothetical protein
VTSTDREERKSGKKRERERERERRDKRKNKYIREEKKKSLERKVSI